jgi:hypothetical protein
MMKSLLLLLSLLLGSFGAAPLTAGECPTVSLTFDDSTTMAAYQGYLDDVSIYGVRETLVVKGFCAFDDGPEFVRTEYICTSVDTCRARYMITEWFEHRNSQQSIVTAEVEVTIEVLSGVETATRVTLSDIVGPLRATTLGENDSEVILQAAEISGVPEGPLTSDGQRRIASRVECLRATFPRAPTSCSFKMRDQIYELMHEEAPLQVYATLAALGGIGERVPGLTRVGAAAINCHRIRTETPDGIYFLASCTLYSETMP